LGVTLIPPFYFIIMLHFNELYITEDGKHIVIDVEIDNLDAYNTCYIDTVSIGVMAECSDNIMPDNSVIVYSIGKNDGDASGDELNGKTLSTDTQDSNGNSSDSSIYAADNVYTTRNGKHVQICLDTTDTAIAALLKDTVKDLSKYLFVVKATAGGYEGNIAEIASMDCVFDEKSITGVAYNGKPLYNAAVNYASAIGDNCDTKDFTAFNDFLMRYYGFLFALKCGDLCTA